MGLFIAGLALLLAIGALGAAAAVWVMLSARIHELELRVGSGASVAPTTSANHNGVSPDGLPACSPRVRLLAKTLGRKEEAIQVYQNENKVSQEDATAAIEKLMAE